jgi:hypothetical protein
MSEPYSTPRGHEFVTAVAQPIASLNQDDREKNPEPDMQCGALKIPRQELPVEWNAMPKDEARAAKLNEQERHAAGVFFVRR